MSEPIVAQLVEPAPDLTGITYPQGTNLTSAQEKAAAEVVAHFSKEEYRLPGAKEGEEGLKEAEKFWLVC